MDKYALAFSVSNLGPKSFQMMLSSFKNLENAWKGTIEKYESLGIGKLTYKTFDDFRNRFDIEDYVSKLEKSKVSFISFLDKQYPESLKKLENPPIGLFCKGNIQLLNSHPNGLKIAVVGTRKVTQYGRDVTELLVTQLVQNDVCIVSGLALGVDGIAHRTAVSNHGKTIAVLACGVDCCLPSENYDLYSKILKNNGLIVSEYPLSQPPNKGTFLARNRIIAALSDGVLVTEAAKGSGSLVTAQWGLKLGKKIFAVPGQITSRMSDGSLELLKQGAKLVSNAEDILEEFRRHEMASPLGGKDQKSKIKVKLKNQRLKNLNLDEKKIVSLLENEAMTIDEIAKSTKIPILKLFTSLSNLELKGIIRNERGRLSI